MNDNSTSLQFSIDGQFITELAREQLYLDHRPYNQVEELLMSCMLGSETPEPVKKRYAKDILMGRAEFRGNSGDGSFCLVLFDEDEYVPRYDALLRYEALAKESDELKQKLSALQSLAAVIEAWAVYGSVEAVDLAYSNLDDKWKGFVFKIMQRYGIPVPDVNTENSTFFTDSDVSDIVASFLTNIKSEMDFGPSYGWIDPQGTFYPVDWCNHQSWAQTYLEQHYPDNKQFSHLSPGDVLVYDLHWALLHNPAQGIAVCTYDEARGLTRHQKDFLYSYYLKRGETRRANEFLEG